VESGRDGGRPCAVGKCPGFTTPVWPAYGFAPAPLRGGGDRAKVLFWP
jgi:hypothetical protein